MSSKRLTQNDTYSDVLDAVIFGSLISIAVAGLYCLVRAELQFSVLTVTRVLGITLGIVNIPLFGLKRYTSLEHSASNIVKYCKILIYTILSVATVGWFVSDTHWISLLLGGVGYFTFLMHLFKWFHGIQANKWFIIIFSLLLGLWLGVNIWGQGSLNPFIWEKIVLRSMHPETLFHITVSNMLKNYHISTTGLDGIPKLDYHYGSHLLFASLSGFFRTDMILFFELAFPIIFLSLFCTALLLLTRYLQIQFFSLTKITTNCNWVFWGITSLGFVGVVPTSLLYKLGMPPLIFFSESYLVAMTFIFILAIVGIDMIMQKNNRPGILLILEYLVMLLLTLFLGLTKISHLYIVLAAGWFTTWRLPIYRKKIAWFISLLTVGSVLVYQEAILSDHVGGVFPLHYIFNVITTRWLPVWVIIGLGALWTYLLFAYLRRKYVLLVSKNNFDVELVIFIAVVGLLPPLVLNLGPNGNYFVDAVRWLVFILILAQSDLLTDILNQTVKKYYWLLSHPIVSSGLVIILSLLMASSINNMYMQLIKFKTQIPQYGMEAQASPRYSVLTQMKKLAADADHETTALFIPKSSPFWEDDPPCGDSGLAITSLTGYALLNGAPEQHCNRDRYAYSIYEEDVSSDLEYDKVSLCNYAREKGMDTLLILETTIQRVHCNSSN